MSDFDKRVTITDIAKACGVSATTVSLALRNNARVSEETREKIRATAEKMGYRVNPLISALMTNLGRSHHSSSPVLLAAVTNLSKQETEESPYQRELWNGITERAEKLGFSVERFFLGDEKFSGAAHLTRVLYARNIQGILVLPLAQGGGHLSIEWERFSAVAVGYSMLRPQLHRVCPDQYQSVRLALYKAKHCGYSRPGLVINRHDGLRTLHLWSSGFYGFEYGSDKKDVIPVFECGDVDVGELISWYERYKPDVIVSSGKEMSVWGALKDSGVRCPEDLGFISLCRNEQFPDIAGIDENERLIGHAAVDQLVQLLYYNDRGVPDHPHVLQISPDWIDGASCAKVPKQTGGQGA